MPTKKLPTTANPVVKKAASKKTSDKNKDGLPLSVVIRKRIESQKAFCDSIRLRITTESGRPSLFLSEVFLLAAFFTTGLAVVGNFLVGI